MWRVTLSELLFLYLGGFLGIVLTLWLWQSWRRARRNTLALRFRMRCVICACEFEDRTGNSLPSCPRCGSLNERLKLSTL